MTRPKRFLPDFFADAEDAAGWYEQERSGLGTEFYEKLTATVDRIAEMPESFAIISRSTRVAVIHPFAYGVYFRVEPEELVLVAVWHLHRKPSFWRRRQA